MYSINCGFKFDLLDMVCTLAVYITYNIGQLGFADRYPCPRAVYGIYIYVCVCVCVCVCKPLFTF